MVFLKPLFSRLVGNISKFSDMKPLYPTRCMHTISQQDGNSVLSLASNHRFLFSGSQACSIHVWDLFNFSLVKELLGHRGSVLGLTVSPDQTLLFSCSGDGTVRVWDTDALSCIYVIQSCHDVGDIFSIVYSERMNQLFFGCQNTSIQWFSLAHVQTHGPAPSEVTQRGTVQTSKFFESPSPLYDDAVCFPDDADVIECRVCERNMRTNTHDGYVYCLFHAESIPNLDGEVLISGSGDGDVKIWSIQQGGIQLVTTLKGDQDKGVLSLTLSDDGYLFCGVQGGNVQIWDLETYQMIRSVTAHNDDVLAVTRTSSGLFTASADKHIKVWSENFEFKECLDEHQGIVLSMTTSADYLITGSNDYTIKFWDKPSAPPSYERFRNHAVVKDAPVTDSLLYVLDQWIAMRTVSGMPQYMDECRRGARFLKTVFQQLGAVSRMIPGAPGRNPLVYGLFPARRKSHGAKKTPTVLIYGHYDVIAAENDNQQWHTEPFRLTGQNGYLYGRGTSDNKGPILASIFAVHELVKEGHLDVNVIFLIEGEEESGSVGFENAVRKHKDLFKDVDMILLSNSYWLGDDVPCLTYGLRGVIHASITISNTLADLHAGVEGGGISEPLIDLIHVTGQLINHEKRVMIPGFYDDVCPLCPAEEELYNPIIDWLQRSQTTLSTSRKQHSSITSPTLCEKSLEASETQTKNAQGKGWRDTEKLKQQLMARWRYPTLTVHKIDVSMNNPTIIPRQATATVSMRVVPNQSIPDISRQFTAYVHQVFASMHSENEIKVEIQSAAEYWLGNPENQYFKAVEKAIQQEWSMKPLYIREGGSIPAVGFLERFCDAPAVHFPMGQATDQAHLHNERIRLRNLHAGRRIVKSLLQEISAMHNHEE